MTRAKREARAPAPPAGPLRVPLPSTPAPAAPAPRFAATAPDEVDEEAEWARAKARATSDSLPKFTGAARIDPPAPVAVTPAPRPAPTAPAPTPAPRANAAAGWDVLGAGTPVPPQPVPQAPSRPAPAGAQDAWPRSVNDFDTDSPSEVLDIPLPNPPAPMLMMVMGAVAALAGMAEFMVGFRLGAPMVVLGALTVAGGMGLLGDRKWGWLLGMAAFTLNAGYLLTYSKASLPPWVPPPIITLGGVAALGLIGLLWLPVVRGRFTQGHGGRLRA